VLVLHGHFESRRETKKADDVKDWTKKSILEYIEMVQDRDE